MLDDLEAAASCHMGDHFGHDGKEWRGEPCSRCGETNYRLLGYYGAVASSAKRWGLSKEEAEARMVRSAIERDLKAGLITGAVEDYL